MLKNACLADLQLKRVQLDKSTDGFKLTATLNPGRAARGQSDNVALPVRKGWRDGHSLLVQR